MQALSAKEEKLACITQHRTTHTFMHTTHACAYIPLSRTHNCSNIMTHYNLLIYSIENWI